MNFDLGRENFGTLRDTIDFSRVVLQFQPSPPTLPGFPDTTDFSRVVLQLQPNARHLLNTEDFN